MRYHWTDERYQITYSKRITHAVKMVDSCSRENVVLCTVARSRHDNVKNISSRRNSFGLGPHFCQQNKHISLKKMIIWTTCKAVNCFLNVARVKYAIVTSHLHLHIHLLLYRYHTNQLAHKVRRQYEGLKLHYDRFSSRNGPGLFPL